MKSTLFIISLIMSLLGVASFHQKSVTKRPKALTRMIRQSSSFEPEEQRKRPTETYPELIPPLIIPEKPKIVVLGASGKIGRLIIRQLLEMKHLDATIVGVVRDYDKACRVLFDDIVIHRGKSSPSLQIVSANLITPDDLPMTTSWQDMEDEAVWLERATSAAAFYNTTIQKYDNRDEIIDPDEALQEAIKGCTTIISAVGDVRPTNFWTDYLQIPLLRILRKDVSRWCKDPRHPYYVHYLTTKKALQIAEQEQRLRNGQREEDDSIKVPKIRFVRISDLCVGNRPWGLVSVLTNILHSLVFRYQELTENLLNDSELIETVIIRPGDLVDEEREVSKVNLQIDSSGKVPLPSRIGRDDVASIAIASALFDSIETKGRRQILKVNDSDEDAQPFHYTLACRWVGADMSPYPPQGIMKDGHGTASLALDAAVKHIRREEKLSRRLEARRKGIRMLRLPRRRGIKPHAVFAAIPVYMFFAMALTSLLRLCLPQSTRASLLQQSIKGAMDVVAVGGAFVAGRVGPLLTNFSQLLPRRAAKQYISI